LTPLFRQAAQAALAGDEALRDELLNLVGETAALLIDTEQIYDAITFKIEKTKIEKT
jgi:hypothetical protein